MRRIHSIGLFHTEGTDAYSHCAFTQKTRRLVPMLASQGYDVTHYHAGAFHSIRGDIKDTFEWNSIPVMDTEELENLRALAVEELSTDTVFQGNLANVNTTLFKVFHHALVSKMLRKVKKGDIILHHFGIPHRELGALFPECIHIEPGIGYKEVWAPYRIYESHAWLAYVNGWNQQKPRYGDFVVPNHFDTTTFNIIDHTATRDGILYMGRVQEDKGMNIIGELSTIFPNERFVVIGEVYEQYAELLNQTWPNLYIIGPVHGNSRASYMQTAKIILTPTQYFEPFCGVMVEGALCGAVPVSSDFGVFPEHELRTDYGLTCRTLAEYVEAIKYALDMGPVARSTMSQIYADAYGMEVIASEYRATIDQICTIHKHGWRGSAS